MVRERFRDRLRLPRLRRGSRRYEKNIPATPDESASQIAAHVSVQSKDYEGYNVIRDLTFEVYEDEFISLLGPSGCGKTTLLRLIAGLDVNYLGSITVHGVKVSGPGRDRGVVFQESRLLPWFDVRQNVSFAIPKETPKFTRNKRISTVLKQVGLSEIDDLLPHKLSGGMERRVALARALVNIPSMLLLDEPFGALDSITKYELQRELSMIHSNEKITTLLITHDIDEAIYLSDRIIILKGTPCRIHAEIDVSLPRPRDRASDEFSELRAFLLRKLIQDVE